jgi:PAS domain S-box-containing protein
MRVLHPEPLHGSTARPLSYWAALMLVGTVLATALVLSLVIERFARHHEITQSRTALMQMAWQLRDELDRGMAVRFSEVLALAASRQLHALDRPDLIREELQGLKDKAPLSTWIGVVNLEGKVLAATGGLLEGQSAAQRPWFKGALHGPYVGDVHPAVLLAKLLPEQSEPWRFVDLSAPIVMDGKVRGVLGLHLSWDWARALGRELLSPELAGRGIEVFIARADGEVLVGPVGSREATLDLPVLRGAAAADPGWFASGGHLTAVVGTKGLDRYPGLGWVVVVRQPTEQALSDYAALRLQLALATLAIVLAMGLATPALAHRLAGPLRQLMHWLSLGDPAELRLRGAAYREAHELAETLKTLREHDRLQAAELRQLNATLEERVAERTAELDKARRDLRNIVNALPSSIGYWDRDLVNRFANEAYRGWFGIDPVTVPGWHFSMVFGQEVFEGLRPRLEAALRGEEQRFEFTVPRPDGQGERHALIHHIPDRVDSEVRGLYVVVHDVTEIVEGRRALAAERQRLQDILRDTNVGTWEWNVRSGELRIDERWAALLGYGAEELQPATGRTWEELAHPQDAAEAYRLVEAHLRGETELYDCELRMRHRDGHWVWLHSTARVASRGADGAPLWVHGIHQDVTRAKAAQQQLAASQAFLERVSQVSGVGGWQLDLRTGTAEWTAQLCRIVGVEPGSTVPLDKALDFYPGMAREQLRAAVQAAIDQGRSYDLEVPFTTADGREIWVRTVGEPDYDPADPEGPPVRLMGTFQDVSERHAAATALQLAKRAAESANAAKSEFLANMSHEIRTPLNAVIGLAYLLEHSRLDQEQRDAVAKIRVASRTLLGAINDVLDLAKIEARQMELESRGFALRALLQDLRDLFAPQAQAKGLRLVVDEAPGVPQRVVGDDMRLRQVLVNLLSNALKFTEAGEVALHVRAEPAEPGRARLCFAVQDTGMGIAPDTLQRLFTPFTQAEAGTTRRFGGTGLGLSIVRRLAELMGGHVSVQSEPGRGSRFDVTLELGLGPCAAEAGGALQALVAGCRALPGVRVLVVDDSSINREVAQRLLELQGAVVSSCQDGAQAVEWLRRDSAACDVVLMDVQMPVMDGLEATRRLRGELGLTRLPVLALTAGALVSERANARAAGMDDFLTKPLDPPALVDAIRRHVEKAQGRLLPCEAPPPAPPPPPAMSEAPAWPRIDGIDIAGVERRLDGDLGLFKSLLARQLQEMTALEDEAALERLRATDCPAFAARMHRLRGSASMLGMERVQEIAQALELGLRDGSLGAQEAQGLTAELARKVRELRLACAAVLEQAGPAAVAADAAPLDRGALEELIRLLEGQSFEAEAAFQKLVPQLRGVLGEQGFDQVREAMEGLDFRGAREVLKEFA